MTTAEFISLMNSGSQVPAESNVHRIMHELSQDALRITMEINSRYHTPDELNALMSELTGEAVEVGLFPPFYTDCGKKIHLGKGVFINAGCKFQDQGGIWIGDNALIGHNAVLATLDHDPDPAKRANLIPSPIVAGNHQYHNAMVLGNAGAAQVIEQKNVTTQDMIDRIEKLYNDRNWIISMAVAASNLAVRDTEDRIWGVIEKLTKKA